MTAPAPPPPGPPPDPAQPPDPAPPPDPARPTDPTLAGDAGPAAAETPGADPTAAEDADPDRAELAGAAPAATTGPTAAETAGAAPVERAGPRRPRRRWRVGQLLLVLVVLGTTAGTLQVVVTSNLLIGRMTTDVATAQRRATNLSNTQREALRLLQDVTDVGRGTEPDAVDVRLGLLLRQIGISTSSFDPGSPEHDALTGAAATLDGFRWADLHVPARQPDARAAARVLVSGVEVRIKDLYGDQEKYFYAATLRSVDAKATSERALAGLVAMVVVLAVCSVVLLRRRSRSDVARAYDALRISEERFRSLVQHASDLTVVTDAAGVVGYVSPAVREILDRAPEELTGHQLLDSVHADDRAATAALLAGLVARPAGAQTIELRVLTRTGRVRTLEAVCRNLLADPAVAGVVWNARDVTERRALQDQLSHQAYHDALTGLPNRVLFIRRTTEALRAAAGGGSAAAVLIDLDGFKNVNDTLGHAAGDELLQRAAERLRGCILAGDTVARLGGDEFAIVLPGGTTEHAVAVSRRVIAALRRPISAAGQELLIGASIGVALLAGHRTAEDLLSDADIAMYAAKRGGKNRFQVFEQEMRERTSERTLLEQQLARAVTLGQIEIYYQPIVDLARERVTAVEALARWRSSDGTIIEPAVFIPIAEEAGLIREIGGEVLRHACRTVQRWRRTEPGCERLGVAVNVSGWQILATDFPLHVADALAESGLPAEALTLEITESMLLDDSETLTAELARLRALRVRLAMDDFGAGHSSVSSLLRFEVDVLKIDRMFLEKSQRGQVSLVRAVAELGRTLGLEVVAEGVETPDQLAVVRAAQCDAVQGFLVSEPLPEADTRIFLEWAATTDEIPELLSRAAATR